MSEPADRRRIVLAAAAALAGCASQGPPVEAEVEERRAGPEPAAPPVPDAREPAPAIELPAELRPPPSPREFRAAWVASVANIDWPSRPGLPSAAWRAEARAIVERAQALGLNAIVLQVRPAADALYASALEPWSEVLTGEQGRAPERGDDPLAFWLDEAHRRGLELHAWINPYRARHSTARSPLAPNHIGRLRADLVRRYGEQLWLDPGEPDAAAHTVAVAADLLSRYAVDGLHVDDYFYPYPVPAGAAGGADLPFPDDASWSRYLAGGGRLERADWRRARVDEMVQALHATVRRVRPQARFGISPFGIGKPALRPAGITGFSQYDRLYADVERWLDEGWLDYLAPQLYWPIGRPGQDFDRLLDYWLASNRRGRHVWPGLYTSRVGAPGAGAGGPAWPASEVLAQIESVRARGGAAGSGHLHFSVGTLMRDRDGIATRLRGGPYAQPALVPATPWLQRGGAGPAPPSLAGDAGGDVHIDAAPAGAGVLVWSVWRRGRDAWRFEVRPAAGAQRLRLDDGERLVVRAVDALGREGPAAVWPAPGSAAVSRRS